MLTLCPSCWRSAPAAAVAASRQAGRCGADDDEASGDPVDLCRPRLGRADVAGPGPRHAGRDRQGPAGAGAGGTALRPDHGRRVARPCRPEGALATGRRCNRREARRHAVDGVGGRRISHLDPLWLPVDPNAALPAGASLSGGASLPDGVGSRPTRCHFDRKRLHLVGGCFYSSCKLVNLDPEEGHCYETVRCEAHGGCVAEILGVESG